MERFQTARFGRSQLQIGSGSCSGSGSGSWSLFACLFTRACFCSCFFETPDDPVAG